MVDIFEMSSNLLIPPPPTQIYHVKLLYKGMMVTVLLFASFCLVMVVRQIFVTGRFDKPYLMPAFIGVFLIGLYLCTDSFSARFECAQDAVTSKTLRKTVRLPISKIRGRREIVEASTDSSTRYLVLESNDSAFEGIKVEKRFDFDREFYDWFNALPDLEGEGKTVK
jgi:hypothetical protein